MPCPKDPIEILRDELTKEARLVADSFRDPRGLVFPEDDIRIVSAEECEALIQFLHERGIEPLVVEIIEIVPLQVRSYEC